MIRHVCEVRVDGLQLSISWEDMQAELRIRHFGHHVTLFVCRTEKNQPELEIQTAVFNFTLSTAATKSKAERMVCTVTMAMSVMKLRPEGNQSIWISLQKLQSNTMSKRRALAFLRNYEAFNSPPC